MFEGESAAPGGVFRLTGPRVSSDLLACQHTPPLLKHCRVILTLRLKTGNPIFLWQRFYLGCCSVAVTSNSLRSHGLQHARLPCPSPSPRVCPSLCPLNWWCHLTISSSVTLFSFCLQSFPASGSLPKNWLFASSGQSIGKERAAQMDRTPELLSSSVWWVLFRVYAGEKCQENSHLRGLGWTWLEIMPTLTSWTGKLQNLWGTG